MKKEALCHQTWAKVTAYILLTVSVAALALGILGAAACWELELYTGEPEELIDERFRALAMNSGFSLLDALLFSGDSAASDTQIRRSSEAWKAVRGNAAWRVTDAAGAERWKSENFDALSESPYAYDLLYDVRGSYLSVHRYAGSRDGVEEADAETYHVEVRVDPTLPQHDYYYWNHRMIHLLWGLRYAVYVFAGLSLLLSVLLFLFILRGAGHRAGVEGLVPGPFVKLPFDVVTLGLLCLLCAMLGPSTEVLRTRESLGVLLLGVCGLVSVPLCTLWCASMAMRVKLGVCWKTTLIHRFFTFCARLLRVLCRGLARLWKGLPLIWKTALGLFLLCLLEFVFILAANGEADELLFLWFCEKLLLIPAALYLALVLRRLQKGGRALAAGELDYQTDTRHMLWDFKEHGENLNAIGEGMGRAVEEQLRSERFRTELITNVSHDIKTPLTSILNYLDLLKGAETAEQRAEYLTVLDRHARKLKKLTEDLVEVSKASTGNLEVHLARASVSELLRQAAGEYAERFAAASLTPVLTLPEGEVFALLDGNLLWRVLDNLFSNACKYALPGTRFYIDAEEQAGQVCLRFKNISRERLNVTAEELMERFVRGDRARGGEGSGLGLDIARTLTELQGGHFTLTVDGDLFKAELRLPAQA